MTNPKDLLATTSWFASQALQEALCTKMNRLEVEDGYVFFWEGQPVDAVLIIEDGILARTKALDHAQLDSIIENSDDASSSKRSIPSKDDDKWSTLIDEIAGKGRVTGLLHVLNPEESCAYATVKSHGRATVWSITADDLLETLSNDSVLAMEMLSKIAFTMRTGSKSLQGLLGNAKKTLKHSRSSVITDDAATTPTVKVLCYDSTQWVQPSFKPALTNFNKNTDSNGITIEMDFTNDRLSEKSATYSVGYVHVSFSLRWLLRWLVIFNLTNTMAE